MTLLAADSETVKKAFKFLDQGNLGMASSLFKQLIENGRIEFEKEFSHCQCMMKRRAWKKGDLSLFNKLVLNTPLTALALARLEGKESLEILSNENSQNGLLAECSLIEDPKSAILRMRKDPQLIDIANGWFCILKRDSKRAIEYFYQAEKTEPLKAQIGKGIAYLQMNDLVKAEEALYPIKSYAIQRYPILAKAMGWVKSENSSDDSIESQARYYLLKANLSEFEKMNPKMFKANFALKPWIQMRHGDLLYLNNRKIEAFQKWYKALNANASALSIDIHKRLIIFHYEDGNPDKAQDSLITLYKILQKKDASQARELIEFYVFAIDPFPNDKISIPPFSSATNQSSDDTLSIEIELVLLHLKKTLNTLNYITANYEVADCMDEVFEEEGLPPISYWQSALFLLDQAYEDKEKYLNMKISLCAYYKEKTLLQETYAKLYKLNPNQSKESFDIYASLAYISRDKPETKQQIKELASILPFSFHLARLYHHCKIDEKPLDTYISTFSPSLRKVLEFSFVLEKHSKILKKDLPDIEIIGLDREADLYLTLLLIKYKKELSKHSTLIKKYYKHLFLNSGDIPYIYDKISRFYYNKDEIEDFLKTWILNSPKNWNPLHHLGVLKVETGEIDIGMNFLKSAFSLMDGSEPKYQELKMILEGYKKKTFWEKYD